MTKYLLLAVAIVTALNAKTVSLYEVDNSGFENFISSYNYEPRQDDVLEMFDVAKSGQNIYLQREVGKEIIFFKDDKKISFNVEDTDNCCAVVSDKKDEIYLVKSKNNTKNVLVYDVDTHDYKKSINIPNNHHITIATDGYIYLQNYNITSNITTIYRNKINSIDKEFKKIIEKNGLLVIYCIPTANSFSLMEVSTTNASSILNFYNIDKNLNLELLGAVDTNKFPVGKYVVYDNKPQPIFLKDKKIYIFKSGKLVLDKDLSHTNFNNITVEKNTIYGIKK